MNQVLGLTLPVAQKSEPGQCPKGRLAEDGVVDSRYNLEETPNSDYLQRTKWNVRNSDGIVIFSIASTLSGGTKQTAEIARQIGKPLLHLAKGAVVLPELELRRFTENHRILVLNVAGPRASEEPGIAAFVYEVLDAALLP